MGRDDGAGKVIRLGDYIGRKRDKQKQVAALPEMDEATRDLHAAVYSTMLFIAQVRQRLGLPPL